MNESAFLARRNKRTRQYGARPLNPDRWIALTIEEGYAESFAGQVALLTASNLFGRMTPSLAVQVPRHVRVHALLPWAGRRLEDVIFEQLFAATPAVGGGQFAARRPAIGDYVIGFGRRAMPGALTVHGCGWDSYLGPGASPIGDRDVINPFGPAFAAVLSGAHAMASDLVLPCNGYLCNTLDWSSRAASVGAPQPDLAADLGEIWVIGTGSVGTAVLYFVTLLTRMFTAALIDKDIVEIENLDRSPIFVAIDEDDAKVDATRRYLRSVGVADIRAERVSLQHSKLWRAREEGTPDVIVAAANEEHVRFQIEAEMPPVQVYGTTGKNWQASMIRHIPLRDPCSLCLFPDEGAALPTACATGKVARGEKQIDAALPFLSFAAGLMAAAEILKLGLPGFPFTKSIVQYSARTEDKLTSGPLPVRLGCMCQSGRDRALHARMIEGSRYGGLGG